MLDERVRAVLPRTVSHLVRLLVRAGVTPNAISFGACVVAVAAAGLVASAHPLAGVIVWLSSRLADGLDGIVARETGSVSAFGGYLDITLDMAAYSAMVVGFAIANPDLGVVWSAILAGYVLAITTTLALSGAATTAGRRASETNRTFQFTTSLAEAGETSIMYALWVVLPQWLVWLAWAWFCIVMLTVVQRTWLAQRLLRENPGP
ncbi:MAG TPA: CDP-alcohol phosphatidyltransferase family protein [Vicinamibacterales bacterium]|jgi:phosphatidylglycerophosphate synthase